MSNLIIGVVSILLFAAISGATMWFGGDAFTETADRNEYSKAVNGAIQIEGALNLYLATHSMYPNGTSEDILTMLVSEGYLNSVPEGDWTIGQDLLVRPLRDGKQCEAINRIAGMDTSVVQCPACSDTDYKNWPACDDGSEG